TGATAQAVLGRILTGEPRPPTEVRKAVPQNVEAALLHALEKLPADRFGSAQAFADALADPGYQTRTAGSRSRRVGQGGRLGAREAAILTLATIALVGIGWAMGRGAPATESTVAPSVTYALASPEPIDASAVSLASDGSVAYVPYTGMVHEGAVLIKRPAAAAFDPLPGTAGAEDTDFSPDASRLVFSRRDGVFIVDVGGGSAPVRLPEVPFVEGLHWWSPDSILAIRTDAGMGAEAAASVLVLIDPNRRRLDTLATSTVPLGELAGPTDDEGVWYASSAEGFGRVDLRTGRFETLVPGLASAREIVPGVLLYRNGRLLRGSRWDEARGRLVGEDLLVADRVESFEVGPGGDLLLTRRVEREQVDGFPVVWMGEGGGVERIPIPLVPHADPAVSPDGRRLAYVSAGRVRVFDMDLGDEVELTGGLEIDPTGTHNPVWSPDGARIAFRATVGEAPWIFVVAADGSEPARRMEVPGIAGANQWLDDRTLLVTTFDGDIYTLDATDPSPEMVPILTAPGWAEQSPSVSPDGHWIAYASDEDGDFRVYVRSWPDLRRDKLLVPGAGPVYGGFGLSALVWSSDSGTLYFVQADEVRSVGLSVSNGELVAEPVRRGVLGLQPGDQMWGLDESTGRFLVFRSGRPSGFPDSEIEVVTNWRRAVVEALSESGR
ncbi:MAG: hypothetical protein OEZ37_06985, partial [Gemmatimonadota bacterium]|nr:hypothetical protein [Gemmatimonadota bacterium]